MPQDAWLSAGRGAKGRRERERITKAAADAHGRLELNSPVSDHVNRMLEPRIINWGGEKSESGTVAVMKAAPQWPDSRQLRDPFTTFYVQGIALEPPLPPDRMLNLTEENALHAACLMAKARDACGRGWEFGPPEGKEGDKKLTESPLPDKLKNAIKGLCPEYVFQQLLYMAAWEMDAIGWSAWEVVRVFDGWKPGKYAPVGAIYPIPAHTLRATLDPRKWVQIRAGRVRYFKKFGADADVHNETGTVYEWTNKDDIASLAKVDKAYLASELIIFKDYTPRSLWYGVPSWVSAIATVAEMTAIREFNVSWFASGGQTDYSIHFKAADIETAKNMLDEAQQQMREKAGRGHTFLLTAGTADTEVAVEKLGELLREGHFRFRRQDLAKEVLMAHNVPPYRIGWAEIGALQGNAAAEMLNAYKFGSIKPIQTIMQERLMQTLFNPKVGGIDTDIFRITMHDLELDEMEMELNLVKTGVTTGFMSPNQARERLEMDIDDEHDELNDYYFNGKKLGADSGGGDGFDQTSDFGDGGDQDQEGGDQDQDQQQTQRKRGFRARDIYRMVERFERALTKALGDDVIDPEPTDKTPRRRRPAVTVTPADPSRDGRPNVA